MVCLPLFASRIFVMSFIGMFADFMNSVFDFLGRKYEAGRKYGDITPPHQEVLVYK